jgi:pyridoxal phosphate enzyme (YggS family)
MREQAQSGQNVGTIAANVRSVFERMRQAAARAGRQSDEIVLVAAAKSATVEQVREAIGAGIAIIGENRLQEAQLKIAALEGMARWHFIGRLQRRKVKSVVGVFEMIHSVDTLELAEEINTRALQAGVTQAVLLEVNVGGETSKAGFDPEDLASRLPELQRFHALNIRGLMTVPPPSLVPEDARPYFRRLREFAQTWSQSGVPGLRLTELSMGMSHDFEVAIEEGATMIRVGTALFGARRG